MHGVQPIAKAAPTSPAPTRVVGRRAVASRRSVCIRPMRGKATMAMPVAISRHPPTRLSTSWFRVSE